jgi:hypothetical protein
MAMTNIRPNGEAVLKHAFFNQYNFILLAGAALFALALGSRVPLMVGAGLEALWLLAGAWTPAFRKWVSSQALRREADHFTAETEQAARTLEGESAVRVRSLGRAASEVWSYALESNALQPLGDQGREKLSIVVQSFVRMAVVHQRLCRFMGDGRVAGVEDEIVRLGQALADEKDPAVRLSLRQALTVGQRRLKQLEQIESSRRTLEVKMATMEMSLEYVRSQVFSGAHEEELGSALDEMVTATHFIADVEAEAASLSRGRITHTRALGASPNY